MIWLALRWKNTFKDSEFSIVFQTHCWKDMQSAVDEAIPAQVREKQSGWKKVKDAVA